MADLVQQENNMVTFDSYSTSEEYDLLKIFGFNFFNLKNEYHFTSIDEIENENYYKKIISLLKSNKKVIYFIIKGDGWNLNKIELLKYSNFIVITSSTPPISLLGYDNIFYNPLFSLAYFYYKFGINLFDVSPIESNKQYEIGFWYQENYRGDRDILVKKLKEKLSNLKILEQKNNDNLLKNWNKDIIYAYKYWYTQFINFLDCKMFLSFESCPQFSDIIFSSDKILKNFILEKMGIPVYSIINKKLLNSLKEYEFQFLSDEPFGNNDIDKILNITSMDYKVIQKICMEYKNLEKFENLIKNQYFYKELNKIII